MEEDDLKAFPNVQAVISEQKIPLPVIAFEDAPLWSGNVSFPYIVAELNRRGIKINKR